jgi:hypothetical protein
LAPPLFSTVAYAARGYKGKAFMFPRLQFRWSLSTKPCEDFLKSVKEPWVFHVLGYYDLAGDLTAPQALDLLTKEDYTLIDVRTDKEKVKSGVPSLPRNIKNKLFALPWVFFSSILVAKLAIIAQERRNFLFMNNPLWETWPLEQFHLTLESKK